MEVSVHIVYYENKYDSYSTGINVTGKSFSDCCKWFEENKKGIIYNVTINK